jgi:hypothetical protein
MKPEVKSLLDKLAETSQRINEQTDLLNEEIEEIENRLRQMNVGVEGSIPLGDGPDKLVYGKRDGEWGIYVVTPEVPLDEYNFNVECRRVLRMSRAERMKVLPKVPALLEALLKEVEETGERMGVDVNLPS